MHRPGGARRHLGHPRPDLPLVYLGRAVAGRSSPRSSHRPVWPAGSTRRHGPATSARSRSRYLNGGRRLAVYASLGGLRAAGAIGVRPDRRLTTAGPLPAGAHPAGPGHPLRRRPAASGPGTCHERPVRARRARTSCATAWSSAGWLLDDRSAPRAPLRRARCLVALLRARRASGWSPASLNGRPVGYLLLPPGPASCIVTLAAGRVPAAHPGRRRAALRAVRRQHTHLRPAASRRPTPPTARPARRWAWPCSAPPRSGRWTRGSPRRPRSSARPRRRRRLVPASSGGQQLVRRRAAPARRRQLLRRRRRRLRRAAAGAADDRTRTGSASAGGRRSPASSPSCPACASSRWSPSRCPRTGAAARRPDRSCATAASPSSRTGCGSPSAAPSRSTRPGSRHLAAVRRARWTPRWSASTSRSSGRAAWRPATCCRCRAPGRPSTRWSPTSGAPRPSCRCRSRWSRSPRCSTGPTTSWTRRDFLTEILDRTGALLLLDIANVYANARNRGDDPLDAARPAAAGADRLRPRGRRRRARRPLPRHAHRPGAAGGARPGRRAVRPAPAAGADAGARRPLPARRRAARRARRHRRRRRPSGSHDRGRVDAGDAPARTRQAGRAGRARWWPAAPCPRASIPGWSRGHARGAAAQAGRRGGPALAVLAAGARRPVDGRVRRAGPPAGPPQGSLRDGWDLARALTAAARPPAGAARSWPSGRPPGATTAPRRPGPAGCRPSPGRRRRRGADRRPGTAVTGEPGSGTPAGTAGSRYGSRTRRPGVRADRRLPRARLRHRRYLVADGARVVVSARDPGAVAAAVERLGSERRSAWPPTWPTRTPRAAGRRRPGPVRPARRRAHLGRRAAAAAPPPRSPTSSGGPPSRRSSSARSAVPDGRRRADRGRRDRAGALHLGPRPDRRARHLQRSAARPGRGGQGHGRRVRPARASGWSACCPAGS